MAKQKHVVLGVTGSIAAYKACDIIRGLQRKNIFVTVLMTEKAKNFITPLTLMSLSQNKVYCEMFVSNFDQWEMDHISLAQKADVFLIAPATANVIGKIAGGIADDLLTSTAITTKAPIVIAPAMNTAMYENTIVQNNIKDLKKHGIEFIDPIPGKLACGDVGKGHLAQTDIIIKKVCALLKNA
ncbi:MAG: flavoprotein [Candidatus Omnitrophica bacterium]|nr:flavoprotein [Candidatus Omnitrophota bacterium]